MRTCLSQTCTALIQWQKKSIDTISSVPVHSKTNIGEEFIERAPLIKILSMQSSNLLASELCTNIKRRGRPAGKAKSTAVKRKASNQTSPKKKIKLVNSEDSINVFLRALVEDPSIFDQPLTKIIQEEDIKMLPWSEEMIKTYESLCANNYDFPFFDEEAKFAIKTCYTTFKPHQ